MIMIIIVIEKYYPKRRSNLMAAINNFPSFSFSLSLAIHFRHN